jgi:hypothetical protein
MSTKAGWFALLCACSIAAFFPVHFGANAPLAAAPLHGMADCGSESRAIAMVAAQALPVGALPTAPGCVEAGAPLTVRDRARGRVSIHVAIHDREGAAISGSAALPSILREPLRRLATSVLDQLESAALAQLGDETGPPMAAAIDVQVLRGLLGARLDLWLDGASPRQRSAVDHVIRLRTAAVLPAFLGGAIGGIGAALIEPEAPGNVTWHRIHLASESSTSKTPSWSCRRRA